MLAMQQHERTGTARGSRNVATAAALGLAAALALGCASQARYDEALADLQRARGYATQRDVEAGTLRRQVAWLGQELQAREERLASATRADADRARQIDDLVLLNADLSQRLRKAGQNP